MNAAKKIRKLIESGRDPQQMEVLKQLAVALEMKKLFDISQLYEIDMRYFELGLELMNDWRLDQHLNARNRLMEQILGLTADVQTEGNVVQVQTPAELAVEVNVNTQSIKSDSEHV